jgi:hypothetical protein
MLSNEDNPPRCHEENGTNANFRYINCKLEINCICIQLKQSLFTALFHLLQYVLFLIYISFAMYFH